MKDEQQDEHQQEESQIVFEAFQRVMKAVELAVENLIEVFGPLVNCMVDFLSKWSDASKEVYKKQGSIYGDTHEGFIKWLESEFIKNSDGK
jgi:hypothetical protein